MADKVTNLYRAFVENGYEMEPEAEFRENLKDPKKRRAAYDALVNDGYDMEAFDQFEINIGFPAAQPAQAARTIPGVVAAEPATEPAARPLPDYEQRPSWAPSPEQFTEMAAAAAGAPDRHTKAPVVAREAGPAPMSITPRDLPEGWDAGAAKAPGGPAPDEREPLLHGVKVGADGSRRAVWQMPDGGLTEDETAARVAHEAAKEARSAQAEHWRREREIDVVPAMVEKAWEEAETAHAADKDAAARGEWSVYPGGREARVVAGTAEGHAGRVSRMRRFDMERLTDRVLSSLPEEFLADRRARYGEYFAANPAETEGHSPEEAVREAIRGEVAGRVYEHAVRQNAPRSEIEYFGRTVRDANLMASVGRGLARLEAGGTGDLAAYEAAQAAGGSGRGGLRVAGTVLGMAADPTAWVSGFAGSGAAKLAMNAGGRIATRMAGRKVALGVGSRLFGTTTLGRATGAIAGGTGNFAASEGLKEAEGQFARGGHINAETGENEGYSAGALLSAAARGAVLGGVTGTLTPVIGNVADKIVKGTSSIAGKAAVRGGGLAVSTLAEGIMLPRN